MLDQEIVTSYKENPAGLALVVLVSSGLFAALIVAAHRALAQDEPPALIKYAYLAIACSLGVIATALLRSRDKRRSVWRLTTDELIGGVDQSVRILLNEICEISLGLPAQSKLVPKSPWLETGLVVKASNGRLLALNLLGFNGGDAFMNTLVDRCKNRIVDEPRHSPNELAFLYQVKWNRLHVVSNAQTA